MDSILDRMLSRRGTLCFLRELAVSSAIVASLAFVSCTDHRLPDVCQDFFSKSRSERAFYQLKLEDQFEIHRCEIMLAPSTGSYSIEIANKYGTSSIPYILDRLSRDEQRGAFYHDVTTLAASYVFEALLIQRSLKRNSKEIRELEKHISSMEADWMKEDALRILADNKVSTLMRY